MTLPDFGHAAPDEPVYIVPRETSAVIAKDEEFGYILTGSFGIRDKPHCATIILNTNQEYRALMFYELNKNRGFWAVKDYESRYIAPNGDDVIPLRVIKAPK